MKVENCDEFIIDDSSEKMNSCVKEFEKSLCSFFGDNSENTFQSQLKKLFSATSLFPSHPLSEFNEEVKSAYLKYLSTMADTPCGELLLNRIQKGMYIENAQTIPNQPITGEDMGILLSSLTDKPEKYLMIFELLVLWGLQIISQTAVKKLPENIIQLSLALLVSDNEFGNLCDLAQSFITNNNAGSRKIRGKFEILNCYMRNIGK